MGLFELLVNHGGLAVVWGDNLEFLSTQQLCDLQANVGLCRILQIKIRIRISSQGLNMAEDSG